LFIVHIRLAILPAWYKLTSSPFILIIYVLSLFLPASI